MLKIKKRMRQALALFFSLFFIVAPIIPASQVHAADLCCPAGYTLADGGPGAIWACGAGGSAFDTTQCCQRPDLLTSVRQPSFTCNNPGQVAGRPTCDWSLLNNPASQYNQHPAFCFGNFPSTADLKTHSIQLECTGLNCGSIGRRLIAGSGNVQTVSLANTSNANIGVGNNNTNYSCVTGDLDQGVLDVYNQRAQAKGLNCAFAILTTSAIVLGSGGLAIPVAAGAAGAALTAACASSVTDAPAPNIVGHVLDAAGNIQCTATLPISIEVQAIASQSGNLYKNNFDLCRQIPDSKLQQKCQACNTSNGGDANNPRAIWTSVGCIPTSTDSIVASLVKLGLGIAGMVALLMILAGGFMLSTSQGDTKRVGEARDLITSAVIGLLFIIFSVSLLQFIGVNILRIPGFGNPL